MKIHRALSLGIAALLLGAAAGCGSPAGTASSPTASPAGEAEAVFRQFIDAINASDATRAASFVAEDATFFEETGSPIDLVRTLECTAEIVSVDDSGGMLNVELRFTGTTVWQSECDPSPEGTTVPIVVTVEDGRIVEMRDR
jgi:hypothetical protein